MRTIDFSKLGGAPLTQDLLDFMQKGYQNPDQAFAEMGGTVPHIISGMVNDGTNVSDGTLYYNGEIIPFVGGPIATAIKVTTYTTTLVYGDGNSWNTQSRKEATFGTGAVQFNYADLKLFQEAFGARARGVWINFAGSFSTAGQYMFDKLTNTVHVRGSFVLSQAVDLTTGVNPEAKAMYQLPAALAPSQRVYTTALIEMHHVAPIFDSNNELFKFETMRVGTDGYIAHFAHKLALGTASPIMYFDFSYQL